MLGERVRTNCGKIGTVVKVYRVTGGGMSVHIELNNGRIFYCPQHYVSLI